MSILNNPEFLAYKEQLESRENYTPITEEERKLYESMSIKPQKFSLTLASRHPFLWAYHVCRIKPRYYQFKILDHMIKYRSIAAVTSRQIGKSTSIAMFAFWAAYNNKFPSGTNNDTKIIIVSHTEDAAKKLLRDIDNMITRADETIAIYTKNRPYFSRNYFNDRIKKKTIFEIEFPKGSIKVFPPTGKVRGNTADILIIDEAAFLHTTDPDYFFSSEALPVISATKGKVFLFSTPNSNSGFFYEIIRPTSDTPLKGWKKIWLPWTVVNEEHILENIWERRQQMIEKGDERSFRVEYEASFLSGQYTFFNPEIIDKCVDKSLTEQLYWDYHVTLGIDFGDVQSRTVVTVVWHDKQENKVQLLWYKEFPAGYNNADLPDFIDMLKKSGRYIIKDIVVDDCVGGKTAIELLKRRGYNIIPFSFSKQKQEYYEYLKIAFASQRILLYYNSALISQIKAIEAHETITGRTVIRKPPGGRDDIIDSLIMACSPYIKPKAERKIRFASETMLKRWGR